MTNDTEHFLKCLFAFSVSSLVKCLFKSFAFFFKLRCFLIEFILFYFIFLAALGLRCCLRALSSCCKPGLLFVVVHELLIVVASHCGAWALGLRAQ